MKVKVSVYLNLFRHAASIPSEVLTYMYLMCSAKVDYSQYVGEELSRVVYNFVGDPVLEIRQLQDGNVPGRRLEFMFLEMVIKKVKSRESLATELQAW